MIGNDQDQGAAAERDHDESVAEPQAGERIEQHREERPEHQHLARPEMTQHCRVENAECDQQQERHQQSEREGARPRTDTAERGNSDRARD